jgi:CDGSH-type Zn-finger protein
MSGEGPIKITDTSEIAVCTCMQSNHWPFCDATHHTTGGDGPEIVQLDKSKTYYLCGCFRTKNRPFCDGSHEKIKKSNP